MSEIRAQLIALAAKWERGKYGDRGLRLQAEESARLLRAAAEALASPALHSEDKIVGADGSFDIRTLAAEYGWLYYTTTDDTVSSTQIARRTTCWGRYFDGACVTDGPLCRTCQPVADRIALALGEARASASREAPPPLRFDEKTIQDYIDHLRGELAEAKERARQAEASGR